MPIIILLFIPISLVIRYDKDLCVYARILCFKIPIAPGKKKKAKVKKQKKKKTKKTKAVEKAPVKEKRTFSDTVELVEAVYDTLYMFWEKFQDRLKLKLVDLDIAVGSDNSAKTALLFGAVNVAAQSLLSLLSSFSTYNDCDNKNVRIRADFLAEKTTVGIDIRFSVNLIGVLLSVIHASPKIKKLIDKL